MPFSLLTSYRIALRFIIIDLNEIGKSWADRVFRHSGRSMTKSLWYGDYTPSVAVQGKCQGLLFSDFVSIAPQHTNFHRLNIHLLEAGEIHQHKGLVADSGRPAVS